MQKLGYLVVFVAFLSTLSGCVIKNPFTGIAPGVWRATLLLDGRKSVRLDEDSEDEQIKKDEVIVYEEVTEGELPFTFEVNYINDSTFEMTVINGEERIKVPATDIKYGQVYKQATDTLWVEFPVFNSYITAKYESDVIEGYWVDRNRDNYRIPFVAKYGKNFRFTELRKEPTLDISGEWAVTFADEGGTYPAIGEFKQDGNNLTGTFITETGDYRYLQGTVQDNKLYLSCFDGAHAFLFEAKIMEDESLIGIFRSGSHYKATWTAKKDKDFKLRKANELTLLKDGYDKLSFEFPDVKDNLVSLNDEQYQGKAKIIQIMGTWCPNCMDETIFLSDYYNSKANKEDLAIIALAYEKQRNKTDIIDVLGRWKERFDVEYDVLIGGTDNKTEASSTLPMLNSIISFPTLIFLDKNNKVKHIHTGFSGPATSQYDDFLKDFDSYVADIME